MACWEEAGRIRRRRLHDGLAEEATEPVVLVEEVSVVVVVAAMVVTMEVVGVVEEDRSHRNQNKQ